MGYDGQGFYYYLGTRACATGYLPVARSKEAQEEILAVAKNERPVIFPLDPQKSYYIYKWLMQAEREGDYCYSKEDGCFYPKEIYDVLFPGQADLYVLTGEADNLTTTDFGNVCDSFGNSTINLLDRCRLTASLQDCDDLVGSQAEILFLPLNKEKITASAGEDPSLLQITFDATCAPINNASEESGLKAKFADNGVINCKIKRGSLLIPMAMNPAWLQANQIPAASLRFTFLSEDGKTLLECDLSTMKQLLDPAELHNAGFYLIQN